mmetsp:Transcript_66017/g.197249  ORF Transcript_66017/g.197249 Transcript_66017/m.197249 type:complete len:266 (-) Transcript_66017:52-849(-)
MAQPRLPLRDRARAPQLRLEQPLRVEWAEPGPVVHATTVLAADENARNARAASARAQPRAECGAVGLEIKLHHRIRRLLCVEQLLGALAKWAGREREHHNIRAINLSLEPRVHRGRVKLAGDQLGHPLLEAGEARRSELREPLWQRVCFRPCTRLAIPAVGLLLRQPTQPARQQHEWSCDRVHRAQARWSTDRGGARLSGTIDEPVFFQCPPKQDAERERVVGREHRRRDRRERRNRLVRHLERHVAPTIGAVYGKGHLAVGRHA